MRLYTFFTRDVVYDGKLVPSAVRAYREERCPR